MKILLVNDYKDVIGGTEVYMWSIKKALEEKGHVVSIFGSDKNKEKYNISQKNQSLTNYFNRIFNLKYYFEFKKILQVFHPDIIHVQNIFNELSPSILIAVKSTPLIMTVHDNLLVNAVTVLSARTGKECKNRTCGGCNNCVGWKGAVYESFKRKIHKRLLKKIKLYITPSEYMSDFIQEAGYNPVKVIPNGIKLLEYSEIKDFNQILYVGRLTKEKGVEYLLRSMPEVISVFPKIELKLVGDGSDKNYFIEMAKNLNISKNVNFVGNVSSDEVKKYYKNSTIVIVPSIYPDNFPTVCIEAMSVGRPLIGSRIGGIPELIDNGDNGYLVRPYSPESLAQKIMLLLLNKKLLNKFGSNARNKAEKKFDINEHIRKLENIYSALI